MKRKVNCTWLFSILVGMAALVLAHGPPAWAGVGSGTLTVTNDSGTCTSGICVGGPFAGNSCSTNDECGCQGSGFNDFDSPNHWDVFQGQTIHINIAGKSICDTGVNIGAACTTNAACSSSGTCGPQNHKCSNQPSKSCTVNADCTINGTCTQQSLECSGETYVFIKGKTGVACTVATEVADCGSVGSCDAGDGLCKFVDSIPATVVNNQIDVCYTTRTDDCSTAVVAYCTIGNEANVNHPPGGQVFIASDLRTVDANDVPISTTEACGGEELIGDCTNTPGSFCCGLTQGAYGAPNSVATAAGTGICGGCSSNTLEPCLTDATCSTPGDTCTNPTPTLAGAGFIPAAICEGCNPFTLVGGTCPGNGTNATTIGIKGTRSVTILDLAKLIAYLPAGGTPNPLASGTGDKCYGAIPANILSGSGSKGNGGGALAGQTMACELNDFLSDCKPPFGGSSSFTASGFSDFELPSAGVLVCTRRSGPDKQLPSGDDVCEAFSYPNCVAGKTVHQVITCANEVLGGSSTPSCTCTASELTMALDHINTQFDQCGNVIECPENQTAGTFTCPEI